MHAKDSWIDDCLFEKKFNCSNVFGNFEVIKQIAALMQITYKPPYVTLNSESKMLTWTTAESASD